MNLIWLDIEATGTDPSNDRIIELALRHPEIGRKRWVLYPGVPIPAEATAVHGYRDSDVAHRAPFYSIAPGIQKLLEDPEAVLCGYCSLTYDVPMLDAELRRAGQPGLDLANTREIDVHRVWMELEPRTLEGAAKRWLEEEHEDAHSAEEDVRVTADVFLAMRLTPEQAIELTRPKWMVDRARKFMRDDNGEIVFAFGKHEGQSAQRNRSYLEWMLSADFPEETKAWCRRILKPLEVGA